MELKEGNSIQLFDSDMPILDETPQPPKSLMESSPSRLDTLFSLLESYRVGEENYYVFEI